MNGQNNNNNNGNNGSKLPPVAPKGLPPIQPLGMGGAVQPPQPMQQNQQMKPMQPIQASVPNAAKKKTKPKKEKNGQPKRKGRFWIIILLLIVLIAGLGVGLYFVLNGETQENEHNIDYELKPVNTAYVYKADGSFMDMPEDEVAYFIDNQGEEVPEEDRWYKEPVFFVYRPYEVDENSDGSQYFIDDNKRMVATNSESEDLLGQGWYQFECVYVKYYDDSLDNMVVEILPVDRFDTKHTAITEEEYKEFLENDVVVKTNCTYCGSDEHTTEEHVCGRCNETGHSEKTCTAKICLLCNEKGHNAEEHPCERCGGKGHLKEKCPVPSCSICGTVGHSDAEHPCTKCGGKGHDASTCQDKCTICKQTGHDAKNHQCTKCGGKGHDASVCTIKICGICGAQGHVAGEHPCTKCGGKGHDASACTVKICGICGAQGHVAGEHPCTKCGEKGHDASTCQDKCTICKQTGHKKEGHICEKCGIMGHAEKDCTAKICSICKGLGNDGVGHLYTEHLCTNCNGNGHDASACTKKKCSSCGKLFDTQTALDKHVAEKHAKCADCEKTGHVSGTCCSICGNGETAHDDSGHRCTNCGDLGHGKDTCNVKKCSGCKETFISQSALDKHVAEKHTKCEDCGKTGHVSGTCCSICGNGETAHDDSGHRCTNCGDLGHGKDTCNVKKCSSCKETFISQSALDKHVAEKHTKCEDCGKMGHVSGKCCSICGNGETRHDDLGHKCENCGETGHGKSSCTMGKCVFCSQKFDSDDALAAHVAEKHKNCADCGRTGHVSGTCCSICGNGETRHDDNRHKCTVCGAYGHDASTCQDRCTICNQTGHKKEGHICKKCGVMGHAEKDCTAKICTICKGLGNDGVGHLYSEHRCTKCNEDGHDETACTKIQCTTCEGWFDSDDELQKHIGVDHKPATPTVTCGLCKAEGHTSDEHPCDKCGGTGHEYANCPGCTRCGDQWHHAGICRVPVCDFCPGNEDTHNTEQHVCSNCGGVGHEKKVNESSCEQPWKTGI